MNKTTEPSPVPSEPRYLQRLVRLVRNGIVFKLPDDPTEKPGHRWFAWYPVSTDCGRIAWLRFVWREYQHPACFGHYGNWWYWLEKPNAKLSHPASEPSTPQTNV